MRATHTPSIRLPSRTTRNLLGSAAFGVLALTMPQLAQAQAAGDAAAVEAVVVTGSRLANAGFQAPTPVTVLGAAQMESRAATTVFDLTKDIPVFRSSAGLNNAVFGIRTVGQAVLDLRGLGSTRTLTLVEGLRPTPVNNSLGFDTNLLPASLIDRTEVVTGGASAAYGSDAVAGVVNFILKKRLEGITGTVQTGRSMHGDNQENLISLAYGKAFLDDKLHFIIGGDYNDNKGVKSYYDRAWGRREPGVFATGNNRAAGLPSQIFSDYVEQNLNTAAGFITTGPLKGTAFDLNGNPIQFSSGPNSINGSTFMISPTQTNYQNGSNSNQAIKGPYERYAALARLEYEITPDITAHATVNVGNLQTHVEILGGTPTNIIINRGNPYIPASLAAAMATQNIASFTMSKLTSPNSELEGWTSGNVTRYINADFGLAGEYAGWNWDVGYQQGKTDFNRAFLNTTKTANYYAALYAVPGPNGTPICGPIATNPIFNAQTAAVRAQWITNLEPGCIPYNPFGTRNTSPEAIRYVEGASRGDDDIKQRTVQFNVSGEPFMLPAGPVSLAFGAEYRKLNFDEVAAYNSAPLYLTNENNVSYSADITTKEAYAEAGVPLLKDLPFVKALDLNGAVRHTDYSVSGGVNTWKVGATWEVNDMVRLRATRSRDIRAPNVIEAFLKGQSGAGTLTNRANGVNTLVSGETRGNPNLRPEIADTLTAGIVFQPTFEWAWGARMSLDYYSIDIADVIGSIPNQDIVDRCFVNKLPEYCAYLTLDNSPIGFSYTVNAPLNLNRQKTSGLDLELSMRPPIDAIGVPGRLDFRGLATWVDDLRTISPTTAGGTQDIDTAGQFVPDWTMNFNLTYALDRFTANVNVKYTTNIKYSTTLKGPDDPDYNPASNNSINKNRFPSSTLWNTTLSYDLIREDKRRLQLFGVVENLFDKDPPLVALYIVPGGNPYDLVGRNFKTGVRFTF